jgi:hypothetical protein
MKSESALNRLGYLIRDPWCPASAGCRVPVGQAMSEANRHNCLIEPPDLSHDHLQDPGVRIDRYVARESRLATARSLMTSFTTVRPSKPYQDQPSTGLKVTRCRAIGFLERVF